jgi:hypothetical protein
MRLVLLILALAVSPVAAGESSEAYAPRDVAVVTLDDVNTLVAWTPGDVLADSYRVYGLEDYGTVLLMDTAESEISIPFAVAVAAGFSAYAVSGVKDGIESAPTTGVEIGCVTITFHPPGVGRNCPPPQTGTLPVKVNSPL